jgi:hypothetical protein
MNNYQNSFYTATTSTNYTYTRKECVRHILKEVRHLLEKRWWQDKSFSMSELKRWITNYDEADV